MNHKPEALDALLGDCKTPADVGSLYSQLLQRMINRSLEAEMDVQLGYARHAKADADSARANRRNGVGTKTVKGEFGALEIDTPRDRDVSFEPLLVKKRQTRLAGMEDKILARYIACMDGLKGLPGSVAAVFPQTLTQLCIVHLVRARLRYVTAKDAKAVVTALKRIEGFG